MTIQIIGLIYKIMITHNLLVLMIKIQSWNKNHNRDYKKYKIWRVVVKDLVVLKVNKSFIPQKDNKKILKLKILYSIV
jgi:hypothetical protein